RVELTLQVEDLKRRVGEGPPPREAWVGEVHPVAPAAGVVGIEPKEQTPPPNVVAIRPGMTMAEIERAAIETALRETRGNRRKAADMLGIGERTLYRKLKEYNLPESV
ncbi:MAG TPA: helix-turn-helix domain-containing protein, partial [Gemmatimonadaceae bacterium]